MLVKVTFSRLANISIKTQFALQANCDDAYRELIPMDFIVTAFKLQRSTVKPLTGPFQCMNYTKSKKCFAELIPTKTAPLTIYI